MDSVNTQAGTHPIVFGCHESGGNQFIAFTKSGLIITSEENICFGVYKEASSVLTPILVECSESDHSQRWQYNTEVRYSNKNMKRRKLPLKKPWNRHESKHWKPFFIRKFQEKTIHHLESGLCMRTVGIKMKLSWPSVMEATAVFNGRWII